MFHGYTVVRQSDTSDCGAAALATIAMHYRKPVALQTIRSLVGTDRVGTTLLGLHEGARKIGFDSTAVRCPLETIGDVPLPAIAHFSKKGCGHFVVLFGVQKRRVLIGDPAEGMQSISVDEFQRLWTGALLLLAPSEITPSQYQREPIRPSKRFLSLLTCQSNVLGECLICALIMIVLGISTSYFVQHLVDSVLLREETRLLNALGMGMIIIVLFRTIFSAIRQYLLAYLSRRIDLSLIARYARHTLALPISFFETRKTGEILSRVHDTEKIRDAIANASFTIVVDGILVVLASVILWTYDWPLALVATSFVPLLLGGLLVHQPGMRSLAEAAMERAAEFSAHLVEDVSGVECIKAFCAEEIRSEESESKLVHFVQSIFRLQILNVRLTVLSNFVIGAAGIVILWYGGHRVIQRALTIGELMFFQTMLAYVLDPLERLTSLNMQMQDALVAVDRVFQVLELKAETSSDRRAPFRPISRSIQIQNLTFRYGYRGNVLQDVNIEIPAGATVAIVGESGSGKSTLLRLFTRFHDPCDGQILADGIDLRDFDLASLRQRVGFVAQDPFIFNGSIRANIALSNPNAEFGDVVDAARAAGLDEFISSLPERYETQIGERGANLSGGQRQRLAIARVLLMKPDLVLFDEATSHLDTATERAIQQSLKGALAGKTVIVVAHRLSTIREVDLIYVLHNGSVDECGTHDELLLRNGRYANLWRSQSEQDSASCRCHHLGTAIITSN